MVVQAALYNPVNSTLTVSAFSYDRIGAPALSLHLPGISAPVATLANGQASVIFPISFETRLRSALSPSTSFSSRRRRPSSSRTESTGAFRPRRSSAARASLG